MSTSAAPTRMLCAWSSRMVCHSSTATPAVNVTAFRTVFHTHVACSHMEQTLMRSPR